LWKSLDWVTICIYLLLIVGGWFSVCGASYDYGDLLRPTQEREGIVFKEVNGGMTFKAISNKYLLNEK
jgi:hypothetical protein